MLATALNASLGSVRKQLSSGEGRYWSRNRGKVALFSPDRAAQALGEPHAGRRYFVYELGDVVAGGGIKRWRALLANALLPGSIAHAPRSKVKQWTGISESTQRRYESAGLTPYTDESGQAPVLSPKRFDDYGRLLRSGDGDGPPTRFDPDMVGASLREEGVRGFFKAYGSIYRESPKTFVRLGKSHRRVVPRRFKVNSSSEKAYRGSDSNLVRVKAAGRYRWLNRDGWLRVQSEVGVFDVIPVREVEHDPRDPGRVPSLFATVCERRR